MSPRILKRRACVVLGFVLTTLSAVAPTFAQQQPTQSKPAPRIKVDRSDQLPRHVYPVTTTAIALLQDDKQFEVLAQHLEQDLRADLAAYDIQDRATLKSFYGTLANLALERSDYETAVAYQDSIRAIEDKPGLRLSTGLMERAMAVAGRESHNGLDTVRLRAALRSQIAALPYRQVQAELAGMKARLEMVTPNMVLGSVQAEIEPSARNGSISRELAQRLVELRVRINRIIPVRSVLIDELGQTIAAHNVVKPDIWAARDVSLDGRAHLTPVTIAVWDTGVDVDVFPNQLFTNKGEIAGNNKDDDGNGYIDDVHGIRHDLDGNRATGTLMPVSLSAAEATEYRGYAKGVLDMQAGLNTPDVDIVKRKFAAIAAGDVKSFREKLVEYIVYAHGTHVAGIAVRGNPAARLLAATMTSDEFKIPPRPPTLELARRSAHELSETIEYFRQHGVRVVNMSWGFYPLIYEQILEANNVGATPEERRKLARQIFDIGAKALHDAMAASPKILFVAAAGNEDADNKFGEFVPSSFDLPNLITAAAVDRGGDEAAFTSYGHVDVYANGYEVPSRVPGGAIIPLSGTSMAAPQVVNLAAKLLAVKPQLTVAELRRAIIESADEKTIGEGKRIKLLNPRAALIRIAN
jgi:subtilisin family serine protease